MVQINFATREVCCKIVFYGPGRSGKTTNLEVVHAKAGADSKGDLVSIATETDRTLYFDFLPLDIGKIRGMTTRVQLYTVPGQVYYNATRKLVLQGADGIVFVADSNPEMREENIESIENLVENLAENAMDINDMPLAFQWNKRDLPGAMPGEQMSADVNRWNAPTCEATAINGDGVISTLKLITTLVIKRVNQDAQIGAPRPSPPPPKPAAAPRPAAPQKAVAVAPKPPAPPGRAAPRPPTPQRPAAAPRPAPAPAARQPAHAAPRPPAVSRPAQAPARAAADANPLAREIQRRRREGPRKGVTSTGLRPSLKRRRKRKAKSAVVAVAIFLIAGALVAGYLYWQGFL